MKERMDAIWESVSKKQAFQEAAYRLRDERRSFFGLKLSLSAAFGVMILLLPVTGAAQEFLRLL